MKVPFGKEWKDKNSVFDFPKLKLDKDEKARVVIIDEEPECEFVHNLRKIVVDDYGKPLMEEKSTRDGQKYSKPKTDFKGKFVCLGDPEVLFESGVDPDNCPACKAAIENSSAIARPEPRFVLNILKYNLKKGTTTVNTPFQVELQAWEFGLGRMKALKGLADEHGDLRKIDLLLGPVEGPLMYQKFPINIGKEAEAWKKAHQETSVSVIKNNQEDLTPILGRKVSDSELRAQVYELVRAYNEAFGIPGAVPQAPQPKEEPATDINTMLNGNGAVPSSSNEESSEEEDVASDEETPQEQSLEDLMASLR